MSQMLITLGIDAQKLSSVPGSSATPLSRHGLRQRRYQQNRGGVRQ